MSSRRTSAPWDAAAVAAAASLGAGLVHAASALGRFDEEAARLFVALAVAQVGWATVAFVVRTRAVSIVGLVLGSTAAGIWSVAITSGIDRFGLNAASDLGVAESLAAGLGLLCAVTCLRVLLVGGRVRSNPLGARVATAGVATAAVIGLVAASVQGPSSHDDHDHDHASAATAPFDPSQPVDLSSVSGATPAQISRAESLVADTLSAAGRLPSHDDLLAAGFQSAGPAGRFEQLVDPARLDDGRQLDPTSPESLLFRTGPSGARSLVAVRYLLAPGTPLDEVPDEGGPATPWSSQSDLCTDDAGTTIEGLTSADGTCGASGRPLDRMPMLQVWVVANPCGPFAGLETATAADIDPSSPAPTCGGGH